MESERCGNCHFLMHFDVIKKQGECHRNPPQIVLNSGNTWAIPVNVFPKMEETNWCGCYERSNISRSREK